MLIDKRIKSLFKLKQYQRILIISILTLAITGSGIFFATGQFGGGSGTDSPSLSKGLVAHWTLNQEDYEEGTENVIPNPDMQNRSHPDYTPIYDSNFVGGVALKNESGNKSQYILINDIPITQGQVFTLTTKHYFSNDFNTSLRTAFCYEHENGKHHNLYASTKNLWETRSLTFTTETSGLMRCSLYMSNTFTEGHVIIDWIQVEERPHATDFVNGTRIDRVVDKSPYANHGINYGSVSGDNRHGSPGKAFNLDGASDYVEFPNTRYIYQEGDHTFSLWTRATGPRSGKFIACHYNWRFRWSNESTVTFDVGRMNSGTGPFYYQSHNLGSSNNDWVMLTGVYKPSSQIVKFYVNGDLVNSLDIGTDTMFDQYSRNLRIGYSYHGNATFYEGLVDDIRIYNRALSENEIRMLYDTYQPQAKVSSASGGLIGHWSLDQETFDPGTNRITDLTPYENHGTNYGATFTTDRHGKSGGAMSFNGANNAVDISQLSYPNTWDDNFSISSWINIPSDFSWSSGRYDNIVSRGTYIGSHGLARSPTNNSVCGWVRGDNGARVVCSDITRDSWYLLTMTWDGEDLIFYVDDSYIGVSSGQRDGIPHQLNWTIGRARAFSGGQGSWYEGLLDDVRIYNRALSQKEIQSLYNTYNPSTGQDPLQRGLILDMPLTSEYTKGGSIGSEIMTDRTPYGNDGQNYGAVLSETGASFNGSNNYAKLSNEILSTENIRSNGVTYTAWIKLVNNGITQNIIGQKPTSGYSQFSSGGLGVNSSNKAIMIAYDDGLTYKYATGNKVMQSDTWHFLVGTYNPLDKNMRIYVDGVIDGDPVLINTFSRLVTNSENTIGRQTHSSTPNYFNGDISNVKIYNRSLSEEEILMLYERGRR